MSRIGDIAIGVVIGVGGLIGAALAWDKYGNSDGSLHENDTENFEVPEATNGQEEVNNSNEATQTAVHDITNCNTALTIQS